MSWLEQLRTLRALGLASVARVAIYRIGVRTRIHPGTRVRSQAPLGPFFRPGPSHESWPAPNKSWEDKLNWFGWYSEDLAGRVPDWLHNPFGSRGEADLPWWKVSDFAAGDIKGVWELSRLDWLVAFATCATHGDDTALERMNVWLQDWSVRNAPYFGANWKCGQEASIRVIHLLVAAMILHQDDAPEPGLVDLITSHLKRIAPTISYALGQQNNHGTSEAAALFAGGSFLGQLGDSRGMKWSEIGRRWLEERAESLIERDGSFSQYSTNYHRLMLDTYAFAEIWRRRRNLPPFSERMRQRLSVATHWLYSFLDLRDGDVPNIGYNDGARLLPLTDTGYRDFRPAVQLSAALFCESSVIANPGPWDEQLRWLGVCKPLANLPPRSSESFDQGGYHVLRSGPATAFMRYPRYRFRPSQADALHLDLWVHGRNLLRDAGTFSYNAPDKKGEYFSGTAAHNTIEFEDRDQMPRLGRFLFGNWLKAEGVELARDGAEGATAAAGYTDARGARHHRQVRLSSSNFDCLDTLSGEFGRAVLRWRLEPGSYKLEGNRLSGNNLSLDLDVQGAAIRTRLTRGRESRLYLNSTDIPVLEAEVDGPCRILTAGRF